MVLVLVLEIEARVVAELAAECVIAVADFSFGIVDELVLMLVVESTLFMVILSSKLVVAFVGVMRLRDVLLAFVLSEAVVVIVVFGFANVPLVGVNKFDVTIVESVIAKVGLCVKLEVLISVVRA